MRKELFVIFGIFLLLFSSCKKEDENLFDQTADERKATAITNLKAKLTAPASGWRVKYRPNPETGSFYVFLNFSEDNKVNIKTDLSTNEGEFFDQTVPYRIDSSLGLELIFETYSFFSFLFDQGAADLEGEFEFNYVNETPEGALVFSSRTDRTGLTTMVMEPAGANDSNLLANTLSTQLQTLADDLSKFGSSLRIDYENKDQAIYVSIDDLRRTINFNYIGLKSNVLTGQSLDFATQFIFEENSIVLDEPFNVNFQGESITINAIELVGNLSESNIMDVCADPILIHSIPGSIPSTNDNIILETSLYDPNGASIFERSSFYFAALQNFRIDMRFIGNELVNDIPGLSEVYLLHDLLLNDGTNLTAFAFAIVNDDNTSTLVIKDFEANIVDNNIVFTFSPGFRLLDNTVVDGYEGINKYLNLLTEGNNTFIYRLDANVYELYNPCNNFTIALVAND